MKYDKNSQDIDTLLKRSLHTEQIPDDELHQKVMQKWKEHKMSKKRSYKVAAVWVAGILALSTLSVGAAVHFMAPSEVASDMGFDQIAELFKGENAVDINKTQTSDQYSFTLLGITEGENLEALDDHDLSLQKDHFYAVVAISNRDGSDLKLEEFQKGNYFISPLIQGLQPWMYNIASMNGGYSENEKDGVVYRMIDCSKIGYFADRKLYLVISDTTFFEKEAYKYDETTGEITRDSDYQGTNLIFDLPMDKSKADPEKATVYLKELDDSWKEDVEENESQEKELQNSSDSELVKRNRELLSYIKDPGAAADYTVLLETLNTIPDDSEKILSNLGMTMSDEQNLTEEDGYYTFEQVVDEETKNQITFGKDEFENGLAISCQYEESDSDADLIIIIAKLKDDGTASGKLFQKKYKK